MFNKSMMNFYGVRKTNSNANFALDEKSDEKDKDGILISSFEKTRKKHSPDDDLFIE